MRESDARGLGEGDEVFYRDRSGRPVFCRVLTWHPKRPAEPGMVRVYEKRTAEERVIRYAALEFTNEVGRRRSR